MSTEGIREEEAPAPAETKTAPEKKASNTIDKMLFGQFSSDNEESSSPRSSSSRNQLKLWSKSEMDAKEALLLQDNSKNKNDTVPDEGKDIKQQEDRSASKASSAANQQQESRPRGVVSIGPGDTPIEETPKEIQELLRNSPKVPERLPKLRLVGMSTHGSSRDHVSFSPYGSDAHPHSSSSPAESKKSAGPSPHEDHAVATGGQNSSGWNEEKQQPTPLVPQPPPAPSPTYDLSSGASSARRRAAQEAQDNVRAIAGKYGSSSGSQSNYIASSGTPISTARSSARRIGGSQNELGESDRTSSSRSNRQVVGGGTGENDTHAFTKDQRQPSLGSRAPPPPPPPEPAASTTTAAAAPTAKRTSGGALDSSRSKQSSDDGENWWTPKADSVKEEPPLTKDIFNFGSDDEAISEDFESDDGLDLL
ncbi:unnamed protein product [Amoebophrya sp. A25]|nr:unnamed protein product [Amoebophrya sp. A25]|eukprot:GSA25T00007837001.1